MLVYECWMTDQKGSFRIFNEDEFDGVELWVNGMLADNNSVGTHLHIVIHSSDEYDPTKQYHKPKGWK